MAPGPQATTLDKLLLIPHVTKVILAALLRLVTSPVTGGNKNASRFRDVVFAAFRTHLAGLSVAQERYLDSKTTDQGYDEFIQTKYQANYTDELPGGGKLHWMGAKRSRYTILWFHGGGFNLAASPGHWQWFWELKTNLERHYSISIAIPSYTLAPEAHFPTQLKQAVESVRFLLEKETKYPGNVILAGDSAGGNLVAGVLSHILHPHPDIPELKPSGTLNSAVFVSPWVQFIPTGGSADANAMSDMIARPTAERWSSAYLGEGRKSDVYTEPCLADDKWFSGLNKVVREVFIYGGAQEVLIDAIETFSKQLKAVHPKVEFVKQPGAYHEDFILDKLLGYSQTAPGGQIVENWMGERMERQEY